MACDAAAQSNARVGRNGPSGAPRACGAGLRCGLSGGDALPARRLAGRRVEPGGAGRADAVAGGVAVGGSAATAAGRRGGRGNAVHRRAPGRNDAGEGGVGGRHIAPVHRRCGSHHRYDGGTGVARGQGAERSRAHAGAWRC
eukprot:1865012-Pleurochrysis_carterae.AAC.1